MQLKDNLPQMSDEEQLKLLATDGMLVKRPILVLESEQESKPDSQTGSQAKVLVGFKEPEWAAILAEK